MHFMERRGSGLRKIRQATMNEDSYEKRFLPEFEERNGFFFVTLWNMNIGVAPPQDAQQVRDEKRLVDSLPDNATQQVAQQVSSLLNALGDQEPSGRELMDAMRLADRNNFTKNYLNPALEAHLSIRVWMRTETLKKLKCSGSLVSRIRIEDQIAHPSNHLSHSATDAGR